MWGKVSFHRSRKPIGESPTSFTNSPVHESASLPGSRSGNLYTKALPTLPSDPTESHFIAQQPELNQRVTSSVYSGDTVNFDHVRQRSISDNYQFSQPHGSFGSNRDHAQETERIEISPPDSPITLTHSRDSSRVSPIEDEPNKAFGKNTHVQADSKFTSHIPILRKRVDSLPDRARQTETSFKADTTRWDGYSGQPTTGDMGSFGQVAPGSVSFQTHIYASPPASQSSNIFGWGKDQLYSKRKVSESRNRILKDAQSAFVPREPWKGASGRSPMVNPIQEKPRARSSSRLHFSRNSDRPRETNTPSPILGIVPSSTVTTTITAGEEDRHLLPEQKYDAPEAEAPALDASVVSGHAPPRVDLPGHELTVGLADLKLSEDDVGWPRSRFSVTTYDPTEAGSSTQSPRESIDAASQHSERTHSIMSRARPVPSIIAPGKRPTRKPIPSEVGENKALPQCPPEMTAQNRIELLEAKKNDLIRRRTNINTIIHELTQVIQPSSVAYDMAARDEVKKTVASLNKELAEIKREEHEIGLKLLRAWKKRDNEDFYGQNTSLWVKRVTS